jgi:hypothetical protein
MGVHWEVEQKLRQLVGFHNCWLDVDWWRSAARPCLRLQKPAAKSELRTNSARVLSVSPWPQTVPHSSHDARVRADCEQASKTKTMEIGKQTTGWKELHAEKTTVCNPPKVITL